MGCNCGSKNKAQKWEFTAPSGAKTVYPSETAARAAAIRAKGGTVKPVTA